MFQEHCGKMGMQVHFKGGNTNRSLLVILKDKDIITQKSAVIYRCKGTDCVV